MKKYFSKSHVSVSVILPSGKSLHVSFSPLTGGGSVYYTDNADIQTALEKHPKFNHLFKVEDVQEKQVLESDAVVSSTSTGITTIEVTCLEDAKEYLVEHFGISRTKLRGLKSIQEAAEKNQVEFKGLEQ